MRWLLVPLLAIVFGCNVNQHLVPTALSAPTSQPRLQTDSDSLSPPSGDSQPALATNPRDRQPDNCFASSELVREPAPTDPAYPLSNIFDREADSTSRMSGTWDKLCQDYRLGKDDYKNYYTWNNL